MSRPYGWGGPWSCPYCGEPDQDAEDLGDSPDFLTGECDNCGRGFSVTFMVEQLTIERNAYKERADYCQAQIAELQLVLEGYKVLAGLGGVQEPMKVLEEVNRRIAELTAQNEKYRKALEHYANLDSWEDTGCSSGCKTVEDKWDVAQAALAPTPTKGTGV